MLETIGNTPLVRLRRIPPPNSAEIWLKIEGVNPTGSYKDRMALAMVQGVEEGGKVFGHCKAGQGRSATLVMCYLMSIGYDAEAAEAQIRKVRPHADAFGFADREFDPVDGVAIREP